MENPDAASTYFVLELISYPLGPLSASNKQALVRITAEWLTRYGPVCVVIARSRLVLALRLSPVWPRHM